MSQGASPAPTPGRRVVPRPPRINIKNLHNNSGSMMGSYPPSAQIPYTAQSIHTMGAGGMSSAGGDQPYWPSYANPFAAGNFMAKGFEGFVDFTKSGMSSGEKFTFKMYSKVSKWSKKWFTHIFLLFVMALYTFGGALVFKGIEGRNLVQSHWDLQAKQNLFFKAMHELYSNYDQMSKAEFNGSIVFTLREHSTAVHSLLNNNSTLEELARIKDPWSFWNAMFYCGTIYTTIGE